ncbi:MAG TPA: UvrD-helicase domain-containing protein [Acidobacteriota bacterium]|nr:UvrD-helicase domain-containing protein [Acidobacteriota bacterium]
MNRLLSDLNDAQREAVTTTEGPVLVIAGAGSGKTRVLTRRLAYLLTERLAEPHQILAVTFTNKAAGEMRERVARLMGGELPGSQVSTFHSFCARVLRREAQVLGYSSDFTIFDADDSKTLIKNCLKKLGFSETQFPHRGQLRTISGLKDRMISSEAYAATASGYFETRSAQIYSLYQKRARECNAMDFDDLLFNAVWLLRNDPQVGRKYRQRFRYLMVDEYQDTNHVQYLLLKELLDHHQNLCVVGDEDQSIYGWRGADIRNILDFEKDFPGARVVKLEQNYRSTGTILKAASAVIANNEMRKGKTLYSTLEEGAELDLVMVDNAEEEAAWVVDRIVASNGALKETAILYRTNAQSRPLEEQLRRRGIPYQVFGGVAFYARKEIKDLLAYLRLTCNPADDVAFERIINYPRRGIGAKTLGQIAAIARDKGVSLHQVAVEAENCPELTGKVKRIEPFVQIIEKYRLRYRDEPVDLVTQDLVEELMIIPDLMTEDPVSGQTRVENVEAFIEGIVEYAQTRAEPRLSEYLQEISLFTDIDAYREIDDKVVLMTIHSAKGLEYDTVFMVGLEEGRFPLQRAIVEPAQLEEERRLFYVGMTRARKRVYLSLAAVRFQFGEVESIPSRFVREIPGELVVKCDQRTGSHLHRPAPGRAAGRTLPADLSGDISGTHYEYEGQEMFRVGCIVSHPTFGRGKIARAEGFGESLRLEIMFPGVGMKKIMAKYARLRVIG